MINRTARSSLHALLDHDACDGWHDFAGTHSISVTSLVNAIGMQLADADADSSRIIRLDHAIQIARDTDRLRRARRRGERTTSHA
jgi:hypothetical protein